VKECASCYDGYLLDNQSKLYKEADYQIDKLVDSGNFINYYMAHNMIRKDYPEAFKKCMKCNGRGKVNS
jgi:hypothetical protein